jgi:hypothetical protein
MSDPNKKVYVTRKTEFYDKTIEQIRAEIDAAVEKMKTIDKVAQPKEWKELNNFRVRAYARIRKITPKP